MKKLEDGIGNRTKMKLPHGERGRVGLLEGTRANGSAEATVRAIGAVLVSAWCVRRRVSRMARGGKSTSACAAR